MNDLKEKQPRLRTSQTVLAIFLAICILAIAQLLSMLIGNLFVTIGLPVAIGNILVGVLYPSFALFGVSLLCKKILKVSMADFKITKFSLKPVWCIVAFVMPIAVSGILLLMPGHWGKNTMDTSNALAVIMGAVFFLGLATGIVEEVIFRGVIMSALEYRCNKWVAIIVPSILFGALHIMGNDLDFLSIIQLLIAGSIVGILFSLVTYESGSIWCSALIHGIWNIIIIGDILRISTEESEQSIFNYVLETKSFFISGGDFGIEASIISVAAYLIFSLLAIFLIRKKHTSI